MKKLVSFFENYLIFHFLKSSLSLFYTYLKMLLRRTLVFIALNGKIKILFYGNRLKLRGNRSLSEQDLLEEVGGQ